MEIYIDYEFDGWNEYIMKERSNKFWAAKTKKREEEVVRYFTLRKKWEGGYPVKITFTKYFSNKQKDLDNVRLKVILDGLVKAGVIRNDNLNCIQEIVIKPEFTKEKEGILIKIEKMEEAKNDN